MFERLKKYSVKILVFTINILLAAIAVLIIREKDQARLLENARKEVSIGGNAQNIPLPSFENSVSAESLGGGSSQANVPEPSPAVDNSTVSPAAPTPASAATPKSVSTPAPVISAPAPAPTTKSSNAKTRTS